MTMRKINTYIVLSLLLGMLTFSSCKDDFLQRNSLDEPSSSSVWEDPNSALFSMLVACYDALQSEQLYNGSPWAFGPLNMDAMTDNGGHFNWSGWMEGYDVPMGIHTPSSWVVGSYWSASYEVISRCNAVIANIAELKEKDKEIEIMEAEAKTIRALIYNNLTMLYHDVPFITEPLTMANAEQAKTERAVIVAEILKDLSSAVTVLPEKAQLGRITKGAAYAILGRVALYNEKWDEAIAAYKSVMKLGYSLFQNYEELFTKAGETSSEIVFSIRFEGPGKGEGSSLGAHWNTPLEAINGTLDLADAFYNIDGSKVTDKNYGVIKEDGGLDITKPNPERYKNRDPRLYTTLFVPGMAWNGVVGDAYSGNAAASLSTIYVKKYFDDKDTKNSWNSGQDFYVIRYSEVLLSLAEALVKKGGYSQSEVNGLVNQVRARVGMPSVESSEGMVSADELLEIIKHERRVELAFEGLRLFDLYRWKEWDKSIEAIENERKSLKLGYEPRMSLGERDYVWPLPLSEIDTNKKLVQHPLWN